MVMWTVVSGVLAVAVCVLAWVCWRYRDDLEAVFEQARIEALVKERGGMQKFALADQAKADCASALRTIVADHEKAVEGVRKQIAGLEAPKASWTQGESADRAAERYEAECQTYLSATSELVTKRRLFREAMDEKVVMTLMRYSEIERAIAYERHVLDTVNMREPDVDINDLTDRLARVPAMADIDPWYEPMHGPVAAKVSTMEGRQ
ncbi:MAG: hypothetical protein ABIH23_11935 [bacterium]